jgi:FtsH-binding integral membrane protein
MSTIFNQENVGYSKAITRDFFKNVYGYMFAALAISGVVAFYAGTPEFFYKHFVKADGSGLTPMFWVVSFAPVGLGLLIQMAYKRLSLILLLILFFVFSALMGLSLSSVMLMYSGKDIALTFFVTSGAFGGMAVLGYTTKTDLTKFGSLMYMGFIGIFIAGIANIWFQSDMMSLMIAIIGVFVFTGLTAYYMQSLKGIAQNQMMSEMDRAKLSLIGGLQLYILFINLFLSLLRIMGGRD